MCLLYGFVNHVMNDSHTDHKAQLILNLKCPCAWLPLKAAVLGDQIRI